MTIPLEVSNIRSETVLSSQSRYMKQRVVYYSDKRFITFDTYNRSEYRSTGKEKVMVITKGVEFRPDLVAYDVYRSQNLWWKIMEVNKIYDVFDFVAGRTIVLPDNIF